MKMNSYTWRITGSCIRLPGKGHMEKQKMETKLKLEIEIGKGIGNKKIHQSWVQCLYGLMSSVLCHYSFIITGLAFMCCAFTLCFVIMYSV